LELKIKEKLAHFRELDKQSKKQRYRKIKWCNG
jgi:hypothetical protein